MTAYDWPYQLRPALNYYQIEGSGQALPGVEAVSTEAVNLTFFLLSFNLHRILPDHPILDTRISVRSSVRACVTLRVPPLDSETGWTGELWSNPVLLILEN